MTIYVRKLILVDEDGRVVHRIENKKAEDVLPQAINLLRAKDGVRLKQFALRLDEDFKKLFGIENEDKSKSSKKVF